MAGKKYYVYIIYMRVGGFGTNQRVVRVFSSLTLQVNTLAFLSQVHWDAGSYSGTLS